MIVLGIETSCDDTSVAILKGEAGKKGGLPELLGMESFSQEFLLRKWGGVVPEIAARNHLAKIVPLLEEVFTKTSLSPKDIDLIGITTHPGLLGPLLTGLNIAKGLALIHQKPLIGVNHLYAHLEAIFMTHKPSYPYLGVLVSGGHSLFLLVSSSQDMRLLGTTIDDAAGEAFDKGGKLMGLGYPAGPLIDRLAADGDEKRFEFPIGLKASKSADLSYSGLKTALRTHLEKYPEHMVKDQNYTQDHKDLCASYQHAIIGALLLKLRYAKARAQELTDLKDFPIVVGGGVACNRGLRKALESEKEVYFVDPKYCTDNGAMIANFALRSAAYGKPFPECLSTDARGRFIEKNQTQQRPTR